MSYIGLHYPKKPNFVVPQEFTDQARLQIHQRLQLNGGRLKHGSSPLVNELSALLLSLLLNNEEAGVDDGKKKKMFGGAFSKLRNKSSAGDLQKGIFSIFKKNEKAMNDDSQEDIQMDSEMAEVANTEMDVDVNMEVDKNMEVDNSLLNYMVSKPEDNTRTSELRKSVTNSSTVDSVGQDSLLTFMTKDTVATLFNDSINLYTPMITLSEVVPSSFEDMYLPEFLKNALPNGRPNFTERELIDWELNDLRSLLIIAELKPDWNGQIPIIYSPPGFRISYLPLDSSNESIINALVQSDLYKERIRDQKYRYEIAKHTVTTARSRHSARVKQMINDKAVVKNSLEKYEWRNIIENYSLNLAIEAQCRHDLKKCVSVLKRQRKKQLNGELQKGSFPPPPPKLQREKGSKNNSLLKKAITNGYTIYKKNDETFQNMNSELVGSEEIGIIWSQVQENVYSRVGLNWTVDV